MRTNNNQPYLLSQVLYSFVPLLLLTLGLKLLRANSSGYLTNPLAALDIIKFELFLFAALSIFTVLLLQILQRYSFRFWNFILIPLICLSVLLIELSTWFVYVESGLTLDWNFMLFGLERSTKLLQLADNLIAPTQIGLLLVTITYFLIGPFWLSNKYPLAKEQTLPHYHWGVFVALIGLLFFFAKSPSWGSDTPAEIARGSIVNILWSAAAQETRAKSELQQPAETQSQSPLELERDKNSEFRNIAIIILESTRDRSVAPYYDEGVTPFFKELAKDALLVENAYTTIPHTSKAIYSILCGQYPRSVKAIPETLPGGITTPCLPMLLNDIGFSTTYFQSATEDFEYRKQLIKNMGFKEFFPLEEFDTTNYQKANYFGYEDEVMLPSNKEWLKQQNQRTKAGKHTGFLAAYLTVTPHFHYDPIARYGWKEYSSDPSYNKYLNVLFYQDNFLKNLFAQYKEADLFDNTLFFVLGDHGEAFREHGFWGHGNVIYEEAARIPFIMVNAKDGAGTIPGPVSTLDILPTALSYQGITPSEGVYEGKVISKNLEDNRDVYLECVTPQYCSAIIDGESKLKFMNNYGRRDPELYNLAEDPYEKTNLANDPEYAEFIAPLKNKLDKWIQSISVPLPKTAYKSWGVIEEEQETVKDLPSEPQPGKLKQAQASSNITLEKFTASKSKLVAGDSLRLNYFLSIKNKSLCLESKTQGVSRHSIKRHFLHPTKNAYAVIKENMQLFDDIAELTLDLKAYEIEKNLCITEIPYGAPESKLDNPVYTAEITIPLSPALNSNVRKLKDRHNNTYVRVPNDQVSNDAVAVASEYAEQLFRPDRNKVDFKMLTMGHLGQQRVIDEVSKFLETRSQDYGDLMGVGLASAWKPQVEMTYTIYRLKAFFTRGNTLDIRIGIDPNLRVVLLRYYYPWENAYTPAK